MVKTTPTVQLPTPVRLEWYEINRYGKPAGEVLTAFELYLVSGNSVIIVYYGTFDNIQDDAKRGAKTCPDEVPRGIRPELQKMRIEV